MHEELNGLESGENTRNAACGLTPGSAMVSAARYGIVMHLRAALSTDRAPIAGNIARRAALSALALAKRPLRQVRVTSAQWPPLAVPTHQANWQQSPLRPASLIEPPVRVGAYAAGAPAKTPPPEISPKETSAKETLPRATFADRAGGAAESDTEGRAPSLSFSFRPGERVLPSSPGEHAANKRAANIAAELSEPTTHRTIPSDEISREIQRRPSPSSLGTYLRTAARWTALAFAAWFGLMLVLILLFRFVDPPGSMLILWQTLTGTKIEQRWVPLSRISSNLKRAVVVSEDGRFCQHWGVDPREVLAAIRRARSGVPRGASTITMQVAKNLFLWPSKSYLRKGLEVPLAVSLELLWPKWRIMEVYLNIAEWGPGVFGAEAAARYHFRKPASRLNRREAALLAVALPNPIERRAGKPGRGTARLASLIQSRVRVSGDAAACVVRPR